MIWWAAYLLLLAVLFVRVQSDEAAAARPPLRPEPGEPLRLIGTHHALFYAILFGAPLEATLRGGAAGGRVAGLALFASGVALYRVAGRALGDSLSPLVSARLGGTLVTDGPYRHLQHPMYLGQAAIAVGAPLTLGCRWVLWLAIPAVALLVVRAFLEDAALARTYPEHARWAAKTKRVVPFVF